MAAADYIRDDLSVSSGGSTNGISAVVTAPAGVAAGDQFLLAIPSRDKVANLVAPTGWTELFDIDSPGSGSSGRVHVFRAKYGTDITGTSWTFTDTADTTTDKWVVTGVVLRGDMVGDYLTGAIQYRPASGTATPSPSISPAVPSILVGIAADRITGGSTWTWPSGWAEQSDLMSDSGGTNAVSGSTAVYDTTPAAAGTYSVSPTASLSSTHGYGGIFAFAVSGGGGTPPADGSPMTTVDLLARSNKLTPNTTYTTQFREGAPTADRTYDLRGTRCEGYFDADAIFGFGEFDDGAGGTTATAHETNQRPIELGDSTAATRLAIVGGIVTGDQPVGLTWNRMKHGSHIQQALDDGSTGDEAWALIQNNENQDGDPRVHIAEGSWAIIDGLRTYNTHDGFGLYGPNSDTRSGMGTAWFRNCWFSLVHDDGIENDRQRKLYVDDCLFEDVYTFLSTRSPDETGTSQSTKPQTIRNTIVKFKAYPGPYQQPSSSLKHDLIYKHQTNSPPLVMENVILQLSAPRSSSSTVLPTFAGCSYTNVTIVWTGSGAYPGNVPSGVTVTTDVSVMNDAIAEWKGRHGVTSFESVDMAKMINPDATYNPATPNLLPSGLPGAQGNNTLTGVTAGTSLNFTGNWRVDDGPTGGTVTISWWLDGSLHSSITYTAVEIGVYGSLSPTPWVATAGQHTVEIRIDSGNTIAETNETDNTASRTFTVAAATGGELPQGTLPGAISGIMPEAHGHNPVYCDANGNFYTFMEQPLAGGNLPKAMKSTDGGATWVEQDAANAPTQNDLESGWSFHDTTNKLLGFMWTDDTSIFYNTFNTSDAGSNPDKWQIRSEIAASVSSGSRASAAMARLSDGRVRAVALDTTSASTYLTKSTTTTAGGWSAKASLGTGIGPVCCVGAADKLHIFLHDTSGRTVQYRTLTSANVLSSAVRADTAGTNTSSRNWNAISNPVYYDASGTEVISALYAAASGLRCIRVIGGVITDELVDSANPTISPDGTVGGTGNDGPVAHLAVWGTTLYAVWSDASTGDLIMKTKAHGGSWSARTILWASGSEAVHWTYNNVFTRGNQVLMAYTYDRGPHADDESNNTYNHLVLATTGPSNLNKARMGASLIAALKVGSSSVSKLYSGATQLWP